MLDSMIQGPGGPSFSGAIFAAMGGFRALETKIPSPHRSQLPGTEQLTHGIHNPRPGPKDGPIAVGTAREAGSGEGKGG